MCARSWVATLLLTSYLLLAGTGFINAPNQPRYALAPSHVHQVHHHQDRYANFDGMDLGLDELSDLTVSPNADTSLPNGEPVLKITGIDAHCLPGDLCFCCLLTHPANALRGGHWAVALTAGYRAIDAPPW